jgi:hypothetical protein
MNLRYLILVYVVLYFIYEHILWGHTSFWQDVCVKDEQAALNKIATILSGLTAKKTSMVR